MNFEGSRMARIAWAIVLSTLSIYLLSFTSAPLAAWGECPECREWCGYGLTGDACMVTCPCDDVLPQASPQTTFGAIAHSFGDGHNSKAMRGSTSKEAHELALAHCRSNSSTPAQCKVVTWYVNSCGALATGNNAYASVGGGNNVPPLTRLQAENAALAACRKEPRNGQCRLEISGCSDELTPEEEAENEEIKAGVVDAMHIALCALWRELPACSGVTAPTAKPPANVERARLNQLLTDARDGNPKAQQQLGYAYHIGKGVKQDYAAAAEWYRKAAAQGNADAQTNLGVMYQQGQGVQQDYAQAAALYRNAAELGSADAQSNLGMLYHQGLGVELDYAQAAHWYQKAAAQGHADAQRKLDILARQASPGKK